MRIRNTDFLAFLSLSHLLISSAHAFVTVYSTIQQPFISETSTAPSSKYTGPAAFDPTELDAPPVPDPPPPTEFNIQLTTNGMTNLSIPLQGNFLGFSIEFSVVDQVIGRNATYINVAFLNLMGTLASRGGKVQIRVGGNSQDSATLVSSLPNGQSIEKDNNNTSGTTNTPPLVFTPEIIYMLANVSSLVDIEWFLGVPLNSTSNLRLGIAEVGSQVLGSSLKGLQIGNEPDLYVQHGHRPTGYGPADYDREFSIVAAALDADPNFPLDMHDKLIGPNIASGDWLPEQVWDVGFLTNHPELSIVAVEHYPTDNCFVTFGFGIDHPPQEVFSDYLNHTSGVDIVKMYLNSSRLVQNVGKPFYMFETNTASCGGFQGVSNSFGAAMWALDYAMQMAYSNFSGALLHVGGQDTYYNPFTPPPTNVSTFKQWTVGSTFYSSVIMAEALGPSGNAQVVDLDANDGNIYTPAYAIYENGSPVRVLVFNYVTDPSGAANITVSISVGGGQTGQLEATPAEVKVKFFTASSVAQVGNLQWAGQTFGTFFSSDGRLQGQEAIAIIGCDQRANTCTVTIPAPGVALIFLTDEALEESETTTMTFSTTAVTKLANTATIAGSVLATSNGENGGSRQLGSTSKGSSGVAGMRDMRQDLTIVVMFSVTTVVFFGLVM